MAELVMPCPFCGAGETRFDEQKHWTGLRYVVIAVTLRHWCDSNDARKPTITITRKTEDECLLVWERRV